MPSAAAEVGALWVVWRVLGCLEPVATSAGKRWRLRERGLRLMADANHLPLQSSAMWPQDGTGKEMPTLVQRGESWLIQRIEHTAGVYGFFAALATAARRVSEQALCWWETEAACERRYRVGEQWYNLRPDALAESARPHLVADASPFSSRWTEREFSKTMCVRRGSVKSGREFPFSCWQCSGLDARTCFAKTVRLLSHPLV